jgi:hypothetical protein
MANSTRLDHGSSLAPGMSTLPPLTFLDAEMFLAGIPGYPPSRTRVTVRQFVAALGTAGVWEAAGNGWIYRLSQRDQLTGRTDTMALSFVPAANGAALLDRAAENGRDISLFMFSGVLDAARGQSFGR